MFIFGGGSPSSEYQISRSLRFNSADSANCTRTFGTPTTQDTFTFSAWVKRSALGSLQNIFGVSTNNSIGFPAADTLVVTLAGSAIITTSGLYRDPSAWAHIVYRQTTGAAYLYWNNVEVGTSATVSAVFNTAVTHTLGAANAANYFNGYLSDVCFIDGQSLAPSSFGQTNSISGAWEPKSLAGLTAGANGFWLKFADNSSATTTNNSAGLGIDSLSTNYWTTTNFSVTAGVTNDSLTDTPTNYGDDTGAGGEVRGNYCIFNPLDANTVTLSDGNAKLATAAASWNGSRGSIAVPATGHWYFEITVSTAPGGVMIGVSSATAARPTYPGTTSDDNSVGYFSIDGKKYINGAAGLAYGDTYTSADVIGVEINAGTLTFYKNNVSQGSAQTGMSGDLFPHVSVFNNGGDTVVGNFGQRQFTYTAPAGAKAICTQNLTNPTIAKPSTHFDIDTYTGTAATRTKTGVGFQPDLVWFKGRSGATDHAVYDVARGVEKRLETNNTDDEVTGDTTGLTAFTSDGYTEGALAQINTSAATYAAWMWKCGGAAASNTSGSITSSVSTNPTAGVSIGTYTGQTAAGTVGHGLGVVPKLIIVKARTTASTDTGWAVYHGSLANTEHLLLNSTAGKATGSSYWNSTTPTSSVFSVGTLQAPVNTLSDTYVFQAFAEINGFSKFGSYTGNGSADGPFVWCGLLPAFVLIKRTDSTSDWYIWDMARDTYNVVSATLLADTAGAETSATSIDALSNGFKCRSATVVNASGGTYIFAAFAKNPFKHARGR